MVKDTGEVESRKKEGREEERREDGDGDKESVFID